MGNSSSSSSLSSYRCSLLLGIGVICCRLHSASGASLSLQDEIYTEVAKSFDRQLIRVLPDFQTIIDHVVGRLQCGGTNLDPKVPGCQKAKCLQADVLFEQAGYRPGTEVLTPKTFAAVAVPFLSFVLNPGSACRNESVCLSFRTEKRSSCWTEQLLRNRTGLREEDLDILIANLTSHYVFNSSIELTNQEISAPGIFARLKIPVGGILFSNKVPDLAALLVSKIFYGFPVVRTKSTEAAVSFDDARAGNLTSHPIPEQIISSLFDLSIDTGSALSIDRLRDIARKLNIGTKAEHVHPTSHINRRRKRSLGQSVVSTAFNKTCLSLDALRNAYDLSGKKSLTQHEFERFCPALIHQTFFDACEPGPVRKEVGSVISNAEKYGYGTVAVVIVSLISVVGILFIPLFKRSIYEYALQGFIALGVGTLSGDALLHLLPEAFSVHSHESPQDQEVKSPAADINLWRSVSCLGAIYAFFLWEICLHSFIHHRSKRNKDRPAEEAQHHQHSHVPDPSTFLTARAKSGGTVKDVEMEDCSKQDVDKNHPPALITEGTFMGMAPLAWMILLGDSLHNFGDGLTIAAAFSIDVSSGISTTIAIFCHEVPHELGDFAILLSTGMSFRKAMALNFLTAIACLSGFYIGIPIAQDEDARHWIFTVAAGMFLYVALTDMLPELKNGAKNALTVVVQNVGLLAGFAIMLLIAIFEDSIKV
ncbi:Zinc transporter ZIP12 [Hypsibius exemplaris]|uniref:Zinc transporter ZIP12 n=1 Tax=Hypsibius exemplaris TaxID=2072580 RepID=A0A1W0X2F2_HYPEX|nr:Zinc transporter ZIP12 [Hypsibius exemplaris]